MWSCALFLSAGLLVVVANPYGNGGNGGKQVYGGAPVNSQNYRPPSQQNYPYGSGRLQPQYQQQGGNHQSNYGQQQYNQPSQPDQYDNEYNYAQQPLYPENPTYYTQYETDPETKSTKAATTIDPTNPSKTAGTKTTGVTTTTRKPKSTTHEQTSTTQKQTSTTQKPKSTTQEHTSTTQKPKSTTQKHTSTTHKPKSTTQKPKSTTRHHKTTTLANPFVGCSAIPSDKKTCSRDATTVSLAIDCSVSESGNKIENLLEKAIGACPSKCGKDDNKLVEYVYNPKNDFNNFKAAVSKKAVSLSVTCKNPKNFCVCSSTHCCTIDPKTTVESISFIPFCTAGSCQNVLNINGKDGKLKCSTIGGITGPDFVVQPETTIFDATKFVFGASSVSCNTCADLKEKAPCVGSP